MPSLIAIFATPAKAKHFADHFGIVGLRAKVIQEDKTVTVMTDDFKSFEFVKQMVHDIREDVRVDRHIGRFITLMRESAVSGQPAKMDLLDGSAVTVGSDFARRFLVLHEKLGDEARRNISFLSVENGVSHNKVSQFVMNR